MFPRCGCSSACTASTQRVTAGRPCNIGPVFSSIVTTPSLGRPTRLLRQPSNTTNTTTPTVGSSFTAASVRPPAGSSVHCYDTFRVSSEDVHLLLLEEAHRKHGVWLTVPPQLAPTIANVGPPAIPEPMYPLKQRERLDALERAAAEVRKRRGPRRVTAESNVLADPTCLAYPPMHQPPPFVTTGTRNFWVASSGGASGDAHTTMATTPYSTSGGAPAAAFAGDVAGSVRTSVVEVAVRAPVDASMLFHCGSCGRPFRRREAAEAHVQQRHDGAGSAGPASVVEGAGPGEITGYRTVVESALVAPTAVLASAAQSTAAVATTASRASGAVAEVDTIPAASPLTTTAAGPSSPTCVPLQPARGTPADAFKSYATAPVVQLPEEDLVDELLSSVWDAVGMARDDIEKAGKAATKTASTTVTQAAALDSCNGRFFIPSSAFVEGKADNRAELEAELASRPLARATPEGAAPGVRRASIGSNGAGGDLASAARVSRRLLIRNRTATGEVSDGDGGAMTTSAAPTAQELSIAELSRHYPNPFGDSPNAALVEQEKEPVNPFRDLEGEGEREAAAAAAAAESAETTAAAATVEEGEGQRDVGWWQQHFAARPYACPLCQRRALPKLAVAALQAATAASKASHSVHSSISPTQPFGAVEMVDQEAWRWYESQVPRFRLIDALEDHLTACHDGAAAAADCTRGSDGDGEVSEEAWRYLYAIESAPAEAAAAELVAVREAYLAMVGTNNTITNRDAAAAAAAGVTSAEADANTIITEAVPPDDAAADGPDASREGLVEAETEPPHVHVRSAVNTVLLGSVRDSQEGFVGSTRVLQYVLAVHNDSPLSGSVVPSEGVVDEELIVVRCMGDHVPVTLLHQQVHLGATLFVAGTLRMNRSIDATSRRSHAYPYVQVVPPLGSVRVVK